MEFTDGTVKDFDIVIAATGYNYSGPMLPEGMLEYKDGIPQLYSAFIPGYYNLGVLVGAQVRYGAGPIITSSAQAFGFLLKAQEQCSHSLGAIVKATGRPPMTKSPNCADVLEDPVDAWNNSRSIARNPDLLIKAEKWMKRLGKLPVEPYVGPIGKKA